MQATRQDQPGQHFTSQIRFSGCGPLWCWFCLPSYSGPFRAIRSNTGVFRPWAPLRPRRSPTAFFIEHAFLGFQILDPRCGNRAGTASRAREELRKQREEAHDAFSVCAGRRSVSVNAGIIRRCGEARATPQGAILDKNGDAGALGAYLNENKLDVNHVLNFIEDDGDMLPPMASSTSRSCAKQFDYVSGARRGDLLPQNLDLRTAQSEAVRRDLGGHGMALRPVEDTLNTTGATAIFAIKELRFVKGTNMSWKYISLSNSSLILNVYGLPRQAVFILGRSPPLTPQP